MAGLADTRATATGDTFSGQGGNAGVVTDPSVAWEQTAPAQAFLGGITHMYGGNPFSQASGDEAPDESSRQIETFGSDGAMAGVDPHFTYDLVQVLGAAVDADGEPVSIDAGDIAAAANMLWSDPDLRNQYALLGNSVLAKRIHNELLESGTIAGRKKSGARRGRKAGGSGVGGKYASVAEQVADMDPIQRENYYREEKNRAEAEFKKKHNGAYGLYESYFGREPTHAEAEAVTAVGNIQQQTDFVRAMPSGVVDGMAIGQYVDVRKVADGISNTIYGHDSNPSIIKQAFDSGMTSKDGLQYVYDQMPLKPGTNIDPIVYNSLYSSAAQHTKAVWNTEPHPVDLHSLWVGAGSPGAIPNTQARQDAAGTDPTTPPPGAGGPVAPPAPPPPGQQDPNKQGAAGA